jgi:subtilisin family serine protease
MNRTAFRFYIVAGVLALSACTDDFATTGLKAPSGRRLSVSAGTPTYVLMTSVGGAFSADLAARVAAAGGALQSNLSQIGVAIASSDDPNFAARAARISGVGSVALDQVVQWVQPEQTVQISEDALTDPGVSTVGGTDETFWNMQWNMQALNASAAWNAGQFGNGARVAVIDGGMSRNHLDLVGRIDVGLSKSFVTGKTWDQDVGTFWHATHVAGIVAANDNGVGTIGVAPGATIISVKALDGGSGSFGAVINGILYAATPISEGGAGANIINMSLGATFGREPNDPNIPLVNALSRATSYARQRGTLVIASAGNNALDMDHQPHVVSVPAQSVGVVSVAATGPVGFALGATNFFHSASYTNTGQSFVSLAGPGGDNILPGNALCTIPRIPSGSVTTACWVFDMVISPSFGTGTYAFADGTSMAAPAVSGVAALIWGKYGPMSPAQLEARLRASSADLGKPGNDDFYGAGFVNAGAAVR